MKEWGGPVGHAGALAWEPNPRAAHVPSWPCGQPLLHSAPPTPHTLTTGEMPSSGHPGWAVPFLLNPRTGGSQRIPPASGQLPEMDTCRGTIHRVQKDFYRRIKTLEPQSQGDSSHEENALHWQTTSWLDCASVIRAHTFLVCRCE